MLENQQPFKLLLRILKFHTLLPSQASVVWKFFMQSLIFYLHVLFLFLAILFTLHAESVDDIINVILFTPSIVILLGSAFTVWIKHAEIGILFGDLNKAFADPETKSFLKEALRKSRKFAKISGSVIAFYTIMPVMDGIMNQKLAIPVWMPAGWMQNRHFFTFILVMEYAISNSLCSILIFTTCNFFNCLLIVINSYTEYLRMKLRAMNGRESFVRAVEANLLFKK